MLFNLNTRNINYPILDADNITEYIQKHHLENIIIKADDIIESIDNNNAILQVKLKQNKLTLNLIINSHINEQTLSELLKQLSNIIKGNNADISLMHTIFNDDRLMQLKAYS